MSVGQLLLVIIISIVLVPAQQLPKLAYTLGRYYQAWQQFYLNLKFHLSQGFAAVQQEKQPDQVKQRQDD